MRGEPPPVARDADGRRKIELEAAEALAGLGRSSSLQRRALVSSGWNTAEAAVEVVSATQSKDQPDQSTDYAPPTAMIPENTPTQMCSTSYQSSPVVKTRRKLTPAEKEERKIRRILANRESARQTIRRRQAVHVELTKKAADVLEENECLKKEKELAIKEYNSLKHTYEFLKARLDDVKKAAAGELEAEKPGPSIPSTSNPVFLHNQPSMIPCFWPSILPSSFQYSSCHSHNTSISQFPMPHGDLPCSSHQGHEHSTAPLFVYPVPWLLPLLPHGTNDRTNTCSRCSCPDSRPHEDTNRLPSPQNIDQQDTHYPPGHIIVPGLFSPVRPLETSGPPWGCQVDDTCDVNAVSTPEDRTPRRNQEPMKPEDVFATTMARRRRKELMKLKNVRTLNL